MNINHKKPSQFELFPGTSRSSNPESAKISHLTKDLTLSLENIIVLCIICVMVVVLFFSFGVEKGKRITMPSDQADEYQVISPHENTSNSDMAGEVNQAHSKETGVFSGVIPQDLIEDSQPEYRGPLEKTDEQDELFTIQVASFKLRKNAQREAKRLEDGGHEDIFVMPKGSYSIVTVGRFSKRQEAKIFSNKLKNRYNDCLVRRL